jgi:hypothetical protein
MFIPISVVVMVAAALGQPQVNGDQVQQKLDATVSTYSVSADNLFQALHRVASDFAVPMGIEWISHSSTRRHLQRSWHDTTVVQILQDIVASYPGFEIDIGDRIVNVLRPEYRSDSRNVLNLSLSHFETPGIEPLGIANWRLHSAVQRLLRSDQLRSAGEGVGASIAYGAGGEKKVRFASGPASLRQILNGLAVSASGVVWVVTYAEDADATRPFQPMVILTTGAAVPEDQQPAWSFIPWGLDVFAQQQ